jgi:uncharacterized Ntn-hydrolase superfamily protein
LVENLEKFEKDPNAKYEKVSKLKVKHVTILADGTEVEEVKDYIKDAWEDWKEDCGKSYDSDEEEEKRFRLWEKQFEEMEEENEEHRHYTEKENCFMDETEEEFNER